MVKIFVPRASICTAEGKSGWGHVFIKIGSLFYDSEVPGGIKDWMQLPAIQREGEKWVKNVEGMKLDIRAPKFMVDEWLELGDAPVRKRTLAYICHSLRLPDTDDVVEKLMWSPLGKK